MEYKINLSSVYSMDKSKVEADTNWNIVISLNFIDIGNNLKYK